MKRACGKISVSAVAIVLVGVFCLGKMVGNHRYSQPDRVIAWDVLSYYAYLPAAIIEHDLSLSFLYREHAGTYWPETLPDGRLVVKTSMGVALMYAPFFLVAHTLAPMLGYAADGFSQPYAFALMFAGLFYMLLGLVLLRRLLLMLYDEWVVAAALVIVALCTNLYIYSVLDAPMSHDFSLCLFALFALISERWDHSPGVMRSAALGLTLGLISLVRPSNVLVGLYFLFYGIDSRKALLAKAATLRATLPGLLVAAACAVAVWVPQMVYWRANTGHFLFYSYGGRERFFFGDPKLLQGLFGWRKGWLVYTPSMLLAVAGMVPLYRSHRGHFWALAVFMAANLYVVFSWWCWWYGGGFGLRALIESYALLAIPLAEWLRWMWSRRAGLRVPLMVVSVALCGLSAFHSVQYIGGAIHWDSMTRAAYADSFLHKHPSPLFQSLLEEPDYEAARQGRR